MTKKGNLKKIDNVEANNGFYSFTKLPYGFVPNKMRGRKGFPPNTIIVPPGLAESTANEMPVAPREYSGMPTPFEQAGVPIPFEDAGVPTTFAQAGMPTMFDEAGVPTAFGQAGVPTMFDQAGVPTAFDQAGMPIPYEHLVNGIPIPYQYMGNGMPIPFGYMKNGIPVPFGYEDNGVSTPFGQEPTPIAYVRIPVPSECTGSPSSTQPGPNQLGVEPPYEIRPEADQSYQGLLRIREGRNFCNFDAGIISNFWSFC